MGTTRLVKTVNGSLIGPSSASADRGHGLDAGQATGVGDDPSDGGRSSGQRRGEERSAALALATLEVAVAGADRVLARRQLVAVHRDAHRAAGLAPLGTGVLEDLGEALLLGLAFHLVRARDDHQPDAV